MGYIVACKVNDSKQQFRVIPSAIGPAAVVQSEEISIYVGDNNKPRWLEIENALLVCHDVCREANYGGATGCSGRALTMGSYDRANVTLITPPISVVDNGNIAFSIDPNFASGYRDISLLVEKQLKRLLEYYSENQAKVS